MTTPHDPDDPRTPSDPARSGEGWSGGPAPADDRPTVEAPVPAAEQPATEHPAAAQPAAEQATAAHPEGGVPVAGEAFTEQSTGRGRRFRTGAGRVVRHRATLVVAALLIGGVVGAGIAVAADGDDRRGGPGTSQTRDDRGRGGDHDHRGRGDDRGPRHGDR